MKEFKNQPTALLYYVALAISLLYHFCLISLWGGIIPVGFLFYFAILILVVRAADVIKEIDVSSLFFAVFVVIFTISGFCSDNLAYQLYFALLIIGAKGLQFNKILKVFFLTSSVFCTCTIFASLIGVIDNLMYVEAGSRESFFSMSSGKRYAFGYAWPTDCAVHLFSVCLYYWALSKGLLNLKNVLLYCAIIFIVAIYTDTRMSSGCILLLLLLSLLYNFKIINNKNNNVSTICMILSIPLFAIGSIWATWKFDSTDIYWLIVNAFFSGRLIIGQKALEDVGIPIFGQEYEMYGGDSDPDFYNYLDCSYVQSAVINGSVYTFLLCITYCYIIYRLCQKRCKYYAIAAVITAFSGVITQFFFIAYFNPFFLALFSEIQSPKLQTDKKKRLLRLKRKKIRLSQLKQTTGKI